MMDSYIPRGCEKGNELRQVNFNDLPRYVALCLFLNGKRLDEGFIGDVLKRHPEQAHNKIVDFNWYYDEEFVIRLENKDA